MEEENGLIISDDYIKDLIYVIRGKQIMLDSDIAKQYEVETKRVNEAVKRNPKRFPKEFCFRLTELELETITKLNMRSQIATASTRCN
jgi:hypothetical protein